MCSHRLGISMWSTLFQLSLPDVCALLQHLRSSESMCSDSVKEMSKLTASLFMVGCRHT